MRRLIGLTALALCGLMAWQAQGALLPDAHPLFEGDAVHEIHLTFDQPDWWDQLVDNFEGLEDPLYLAAEFDWEGTHFDSIGVRFKGNSSYMSYPGVKKSFKLDIDEYVEGQEIYGLDKLNLNNAFMDPSFVREKSCYELCQAAGLATGRTNFAALYINDTYWGLYVLVEQVDQEFIESRFGSTEGGNLWKGDPKGTLEYLGSSESLYYDWYELKTNEVENDWSALVDLVDKINNTPSGELVDSLHVALDVSSAMAMIAVDNLTVNLDSYIGRCCNYYFYHRDLDDRMVFINWDVNESWGVFNMWGYSTAQLMQLDPLWVNPQYGEDRPLVEVLWEVPAYEDIYLGHMKKLMATAADPDILTARMEVLRDLIRPFVYSDTNKMFSNTDFENAMTTDINLGGPPPGRIVPGLDPFIRGRHAWLEARIGTWVPIEGLVLNEVMANNASTVADEMGDYDDWIEITNVGAAPIVLDGLELYDHFDGTVPFVFPQATLDPGAYLVIWADEETGEGPFHAPFKLDADGEDLYLVDGGVIVDQTTFPALGSDQSFGRWPDGSGEWELLSHATPGAENDNSEQPETVVLFLNEFMALNNTTIQDEAGQFEDWVEIYNPGPEDVEMGGLYLTDDLAATTKWAFPDTLLPAGDFMLIWCDDDAGDGALHATFKLSGAGEDLGLFGRLAAGNPEIDSYQFGAQTADVSEGREEDGGLPWVFFDQSTPGVSNEDTGSIPGEVRTHWYLDLGPTPFTGSTFRIELGLGERVLQDVALFDLQGRRISSLWRGSLSGADPVTLVWDRRDEGGRSVGTGVYFLRVQWQDGITKRKLVVAN